MAPRSPKKKVIDGVVKPKKSAAKSASAKAKSASKASAAGRAASTKATGKAATKPAAPFADEPIAVSVEDTAVAITIDDPNDQGVSPSRADDVAAAIENFADAKISEPSIDDEPSDDDAENKNAAAAAIAAGAAVAEGAIDSTMDAIDDLTEEDSADPADADSAADSASDDGLVSSAILEEEVIDRNLDDLINDMEEDEASATEQAIAEDKAEAAALKDIANQERKSSMDKKTPKAKKAKKAKSQVKAKPFRIISRLLALVATGSLIALAVRIATTGIVPNKYLIPGCIVAALVLFFILFKTFRNKTRIPVLIIVDLLSIILSAISIFGFIKIDETMAFLNKNFTDNTEYSIYDVIVSKKSNYNNLDDVKGKTFHSISDFVDTKHLEEAAKEQASANIAYESGITSMLDKTLDDTTYISVINSGTYEATLDNEDNSKYKDGLKIIGELKVKIEKKNDNSKSDLTKESSVIYLSGIDTRSGQMLDRSLSDVNIVITVNPKTKEILMSTIPRDYYVQLHGTSGLPDKLTHAGALGGVQLSMDTIGDLLDIDFNRYIRVNFNFVIDLVDAVGGITVYSDVDYDITAHTDRSCTFHPGNNNVDGKCALAFARERYAYSDGDRHRGRNQEQVIEKIFNKVTSSTTLISRYSEILNSLSGSFDTNISTSDITSLANMQLSDMAKWTINTYNLDGSTGGAYTYSYPSQQLSVMFPNQETVDTAKQKIHQVLAGN